MRSVAPSFLSHYLLISRMKNTINKGLHNYQINWAKIYCRRHLHFYRGWNILVFVSAWDSRKVDVPQHVAGGLYSASWFTSCASLIYKSLHLYTRTAQNVTNHWTHSEKPSEAATFGLRGHIAGRKAILMEWLQCSVSINFNPHSKLPKIG